jgi:hypothetical protein
MKQNNNAQPPEWVLALQKKFEKRINEEKDPFKTNSFTTRMSYWMMSSLSITVIGMIVLQTFYAHNFYLLALLILGSSIWGGINYHCQKNLKKSIWRFFPSSFRDYILIRNKFFRASWHIIFIAVITGGLIFLVHYAGFSGVLASNNPAMSKNGKPELTPEQKAQIEKFQQLLNKK